MKMFMERRKGIQKITKLKKKNNMKWIQKEKTVNKTG